MTASYDGRATAAENYEERSGVAFGSDPASLHAPSPTHEAPTASKRYHGGGLRYLDVIDLPGGGARLFSGHRPAGWLACAGY